MAYTNVNGLVSGLNEVNDYLTENKPDIMGFVETKLTDQILQTCIGNGEYNIWTRNRVKKQGGGVMLLTRKNLRVDQPYYGEGSVELIKISVEVGSKMKRDFAVMYVPPKTRAWGEVEYANMISSSKDQLEGAIAVSDNLILMGDFNCGEVCWEEWSTDGGENSWGYALLNLVMENTMTQWITKTTRHRGEDEPSRLDLIITREPEVIDKVLYKAPIGKSDHVLVEFEVSTGEVEERRDEHKAGRRNYGKTNFSELKKYFERADWRELYDMDGGVETKWKVLVDIYNEGVEKFVPKTYRRKIENKVWFNKKCYESKKIRDAAWGRWRKRKKLKDWNDYKSARNEYVKVRREERKNFEKTIIEKCKDQPKLFYGYVNSKLKNRKGIEKLKVNGKEYKEDLEMATIMNDHFQSVFTVESVMREESGLTGSTVPLETVEVTVLEIKRLLERMDERKAQGPDEIAAKILKECKEELAGHIHAIIEKSLAEGRVPKDWKRADIVPIHKGGNIEDPTNYRPVSLTSVVAKLCERVIKEKWTKHLEDNNLLNSGQFGFRRGRSCATNLICFYSRVIDIIQERDGWADCVYLDLKKAFDKVPHGRLLKKLEKIGGIQGSILKWMEDFLVGREMRVVIRDKKSPWGKVTSGVPQGSVLAPIMFAIYVNDLNEGVNSYMNLFADDAKLLRSVQGEEDCILLQRDLERIWEWSQKWEMDFNVKKCSVMEFGKSKKRITWEYKMGNDVIKRTTSEKDLGVTISNNLSPEKHINKIVGETYNLLRNIRVAFTYMDEDMVRKFIVSMIRPRLEYAATVWSPSKKKDIKKLERIQRAATKLAPSLINKSYEERLLELNLTTLEQRRERGDLIAIYRVMMGMEELDREDLINWDTRDTRGHGKKIRWDSYRRDFKKNSFPYRAIEVWNGLQKEVVHAKSISEFKVKLDNERYRDGTARA